MNNLNGYKNRNGLKRKDILFLSEKFSIPVIEGSLIDIYLADKNITGFKNELLREATNSTNTEIRTQIKQYLFSKGIGLSLENLEKIFELLIEPSERKLNGAFYTPPFLVDYIIKKVIEKEKKVCDPSCGSGAFLVAATIQLKNITRKPIIEIIEKNIFGADISKTSIRRTKLILSLLAIENGEDKRRINFNLKEFDSLNADWEKEFPQIFNNGGHDAIIGNPPYVRTKNLPEKVRNQIHKRWKTTACGNADLFIPFIELGINILNTNGIMGYVLPNGYFNSFSGKLLREYLQEHSFVKSILDFDHLQLFEDATTYTCITLFDKIQKDSFEYALIYDIKKIDSISKTKFQKIKYSSLDSKGWRLVNGKKGKYISIIESIGRPLQEIAKIKTGIATLRNDLYILENPTKNGTYFFREYNGKQYKIEISITKEAIHAGTVKSTDQINSEKRRIIYPYKFHSNKVVIIPENDLKRNFPECYKYLLAIKEELEKRDKGKKEYETWYAYGRTQGLDDFIAENKIVVPTISNTPRFVLANKKDSLVYAGYSIYYDGDLEFLSKILNSEVMWYYVKNTSKKYASGYVSFAKTFIKNFSIPDFTDEEIQKVKNLQGNHLQEFLKTKYNINYADR